MGGRVVSAIDEAHGATASLWAAVQRVVTRCIAHPVRTTAVLALIAAAAQVVWIVRYRPQGGFDGDEATYLANALRLHSELATSGPWAYLTAAADNGRVAPLVPALAVLPVAFGARSVPWAMSVQPVLYGVCAVVLSMLTLRASSSRPAALVAGIVCLGLPVNIIAARSFHLSMAVACFLCLAVLALVSSDRGRRIGWMLLFGAAVGAMVTSRAVAISFVPGLGLAMLVLLRWQWRSVRNVALAALAAVAVAAPWWIASWDAIGPYLFEFGYGGGGDELGPSSPLLRLAVRLGLMEVEVRPLLLVPALAVAAVVARALWRRARGPGGPWPEPTRAVVAIWIVVLGGLVVLLSSSNIGTYIQTPLVVLAVAGLAAAAGVVGGRVVRVAGVAACVAAALNLVLVGRWDVGSGIELPDTSASILLFGGTESMQAINFADGDPRFASGASAATRRRAEQDWAGAADALAAAVERARPGNGDMMQTFFGDVRLLEAGTLLLAEQLSGDGISTWEAPTARSAVDTDTVPLEPTYDGRARVLVAVDTARRDEQEGLDPAPWLREARAAGWRVDQRVPLPDGGVALVLVHPESAR